MKIKKLIKENSMTIILMIVIVVLFILFGKSCTAYNNVKKISDNNIVALTDTINYFKSREGELVAEKTLLIGDIETLKSANLSLAEELKSMKVKNAEMAVYINSIVTNPQRDTVWQVIEGSCNVYSFNFDDMPWRKLSGYVQLEEDNMAMKIDTDQVFLDLTVATEDNKIRVKSSNPYLSFEELYGINAPKYESSWCLVIGPSINVGAGIGAGFDKGKPFTFQPGIIGITAGISLTFGWNIAGVGKRIKKP